VRQTRSGRPRERERGASLVEFALIVPLLTLFLFGIVQFGIAYDKQQSINSAAREAARLGALDVTTVEEMATRAEQAYGASAVPGADPAVTVFGGVASSPPTTTLFASGDGPCASAAPDPEYDYVRVEVTTPYDITIPFFGVQSVTIDSQAEFRCE